MTSEDKFEVVLSELRDLVVAAEAASCPLILIGGQVLAVLQRQKALSGNIAIETATGVRVSRGYSFEPDLLLDIEDLDVAGHGDSLPDVLRACGFERIRPDSRWKKRAGDLDVMVDLFAHETLLPEERPTRMTSLPRAHAVSARAKAAVIQLGSRRSLQILLPDAVGFLGLKTNAKLTQRPNEFKDSFDAYAYVTLVGPEAVAKALAKDAFSGPTVAAELHRLFGGDDSPGVRDVLKSEPTLDETDRALLRRAVVDTFSSIEEMRQSFLAKR